MIHFILIVKYMEQTVKKRALDTHQTVHNNLGILFTPFFLFKQGKTVKVV